jgi:hypothetical protein
MTADDVHAKLVRALEVATANAGDENPNNPRDTLAELVQPLALASIALELRGLREALDPQKAADDDSSWFRAASVRGNALQDAATALEHAGYSDAAAEARKALDAR